MRQEFLRITNGIKKGKRGETLRDFELTAYEGEITLILASRILEMKCLSALLSGNDDFSYGTVYYRGEKISTSGRMRFLERVVVRVGESDGLIDRLSIANNLFVINSGMSRREPFFVQERKNAGVLRELLNRFSLSFEPNQKVAGLSQLQRYQIHLLKLYCSNVQAVLLDQRLMHLTEIEKRELYGLIRQFRDCGMTFIILDYTPPEELERVDAILVVRQAATCFACDTVNMTDWRREMLMQAMQPGRNRNRYIHCAPDAPVVLSLLRIGGPGVRNVSFQLHSGEVAFIESRSYELECILYDILCGNAKPIQGKILIAGKRSQAANCEQRTREGVIGIDRVLTETSEFTNLTVFDNYCMRKGQRIRELWWRTAYKRHIKRELDQMFGRKVADKPLYALSPSEQQRLQFHACMLAHPKVFVCLNPFTNVDLETGREAEALIQKTATLGIGVLVLSHGHRFDSTGGAAQYMLDETGLTRLDESISQIHLDSKL